MQNITNAGGAYPQAQLELSHSGLRAIVTGGTSGPSQAIADALERNGARVVRLSEHSAKLQTGVAETVMYSPMVRSSCEYAIGLAVSEMGGLDVLVNNANAPLVDTESKDLYAQWDRIYALQVIGAADLSEIALQYLKTSPNASIINVCSVSAGMNLRGRALYSATRASIVGLTRTLSVEYSRNGVRVNAVSPGAADLPWASRPACENRSCCSSPGEERLVAAEEIALAVVYLSCRNSTSITGVEITVDRKPEELEWEPNERPPIRRALS